MENTSRKEEFCNFIVNQCTTKNVKFSDVKRIVKLALNNIESKRLAEVA